MYIQQMNVHTTNFNVHTTNDRLMYMQQMARLMYIHTNDRLMYIQQMTV